MDIFYNSLKAYLPLTEEDKKILKEIVQVREINKNEIFFEEGHISDEIYYVLEGCVRLFYNVDVVDKTAFFYTEGQFICAGESYTYNIEARENYQAIEPSKILVFGKNEIEYLLNKSPKFELIARVAVENELITSQKVIASFVTKSPEERYVDLLDTHSDLFLRVPQRYIASFLGVSPETLSRIKARVYKKLKS
ncbi:Crp/Fnr family transcriptional regulator [Fulvivirga sp. 2943]|uniref:Crp/Fnr family transcriptional regulator n=2 Tax=Fulvivirga sediminis TaxID=2803949 RepID=A0A937K189_9BACT|nr:Crp/Fnr family transcriptional regulator [Fulvivirga sediminis]